MQPQEPKEHVAATIHTIRLYSTTNIEPYKTRAQPVAGRTITQRGHRPAWRAFMTCGSFTSSPRIQGFVPRNIALLVEVGRCPALPPGGTWRNPIIETDTSTLGNHPPASPPGPVLLRSASVSILPANPGHPHPRLLLTGHTTDRL